MFWLISQQYGLTKKQIKIDIYSVNIYFILSGTKKLADNSDNETKV